MGRGMGLGGMPASFERVGEVLSFEVSGVEVSGVELFGGSSSSGTRALRGLEPSGGRALGRGDCSRRCGTELGTAIERLPGRREDTGSRVDICPFQVGTRLEPGSLDSCPFRDSIRNDRGVVGSGRHAAKQTRSADVRSVPLGRSTAGGGTEEEQTFRRGAPPARGAGLPFPGSRHDEVVPRLAEAPDAGQLSGAVLGLREGAHAGRETTWRRISPRALLRAERPPALARRSGGPAVAHAGVAGSRDPHRAGSEPAVAATREGLRATLPRPRPAHAPGGAPRPRLRPEQCAPAPTARRTSATGRVQLGPLVRRLARPRPHRAPRPLQPRRRCPNLAPEARLATPRASAPHRASRKPLIRPHGASSRVASTDPRACERTNRVTREPVSRVVAQRSRRGQPPQHRSRPRAPAESTRARSPTLASRPRTPRHAPTRSHPSRPPPPTHLPPPPDSPTEPAAPHASRNLQPLPPRRTADRPPHHTTPHHICHRPFRRPLPRPVPCTARQAQRSEAAANHRGAEGPTSPGSAPVAPHPDEPPDAAATPPLPFPASRGSKPSPHLPVPPPAPNGPHTSNPLTPRTPPRYLPFPCPPPTHRSRPSLRPSGSCSAPVPPTWRRRCCRRSRGRRSGTSTRSSWRR